MTAGGLATLLYMLLVILQVELLDLYPVLAICVASIIIDTSLYLTNRLWVYKSSLEHRTAISRFLVTIVLAIVINSCIMALTVDILGLHYMWGLVGTILILPPTNFLLNLYWVFR